MFWTFPVKLLWIENKANLKDLTAATSLVILRKIGFKSPIFWSMWSSNLMDDLEKHKGTSSVLHQALCIFSDPMVNSNCSYSPEMLNLGQNWWLSVLCDLEIWWRTLTKNRAPVLCYFKLCKSFQTHRWIQTGVTVWKCSIRSKSAIFVPCDLEILRMTLKNNRVPLLCY